MQDHNTPIIYTMNENAKQNKQKSSKVKQKQTNNKTEPNGNQINYSEKTTHLHGMDNW